MIRLEILRTNCRECFFLTVVKPWKGFSGPFCEVYETILCQHCFWGRKQPWFCDRHTVLVLEDGEERDLIWQEEDIEWVTTFRAPESCRSCFLARRPVAGRCPAYGGVRPIPISGRPAECRAGQIVVVRKGR